MAGKPSIKNLAVKDARDARSGKTSKLRLKAIRLLIARKLVPLDEVERLIRALLKTAKESYIRVHCYELLEKLDVEKHAYLEEVAKPVEMGWKGNVFEKLGADSPAKPPVPVKEISPELKKLLDQPAVSKAQPVPVSENVQKVNEMVPPTKVEAPSMPAEEKFIEAEEAAAPAPVAEPVKVQPPRANPVWWGAWVDNAATGRGSGFDIDRETAIPQLEEQSRKKARQRERDPYMDKVPLGAW